MRPFSPAGPRTIKSDCNWFGKVDVRSARMNEEDRDLVVDEPRQFSAGGALWMSDEARCVLLDQAVIRGPLRSVALVLKQGAIRHPPGLPADGLREGLPNGDSERSQAVRSVSIAPDSRTRCVPSAAGRPAGDYGGCPTGSFVATDLLAATTTVGRFVEFAWGGASPRQGDERHGVVNRSH